MSEKNINTTNLEAADVFINAAKSPLGDLGVKNHLELVN